MGTVKGGFSPRRHRILSHGVIEVTGGATFGHAAFRTVTIDTSLLGREQDIGGQAAVLHLVAFGAHNFAPRTVGADQMFAVIKFAANHPTVGDDGNTHQRRAGAGLDFMAIGATGKDGGTQDGRSAGGGNRGVARIAEENAALQFLARTKITL